MLKEGKDASPIQWIQRGDNSNSVVTGLGQVGHQLYGAVSRFPGSTIEASYYQMILGRNVDLWFENNGPSKSGLVKEAE